MSEDTNTTQSAEVIWKLKSFNLNDHVIYKGDSAMYNIRYHDQAVKITESLNELERRRHSEQLAQAKLPSEEDIGNYWSKVFDPKTKADELIAAQLGAICTRDLMRPYITRIEQENAELKKHGYDNMQYYMEYCQRNGYVTPQEWIEKHKHF